MLYKRFLFFFFGTIIFVASRLIFSFLVRRISYLVIWLVDVVVVVVVVVVWLFPYLLTLLTALIKMSNILSNLTCLKPNLRFKTTIKVSQN